MMGRKIRGKRSPEYALSVAVALFCIPVLAGSSWARERHEPLPTTAVNQAPSTEAIPATVPAREAAPGGLATALAACDREESGEPLTLPGARGEVKLDRCYHGRDHLVCSLNALLKEARSLVEDYSKIVEARYPEVGNVEGVCTIKPDSLSGDLQSAADFASRFKVLKAEYDSRINCANKVGQSLRDVTLPDMAQAPGILKSMIDSIESDVKGVSLVQTKVVELADKIDTSQKAMVTIRKIHRTMCLKDQRAMAQPEGHANR